MLGETAWQKLFGGACNWTSSLGFTCSPLFASTPHYFPTSKISLMMNILSRSPVICLLFQNITLIRAGKRDVILVKVATGRSFGHHPPPPITPYLSPNTTWCYSITCYLHYTVSQSVPAVKYYFILHPLYSMANYAGNLHVCQFHLSLNLNTIFFM